MLYINGNVSTSSTNLWEPFFKLRIRLRIDEREPKIINLDLSRQALHINEKLFQTWLSFSNYCQKKKYLNGSEASILIKIIQFFGFE